MVEKIVMDGITYNVRVVYKGRTRSFELISGSNAGRSLSARKIRDILGTGYSYQMQIEPDPAHPGDYDAFFEAISAPVDYHTITMPYGQSTMTYQAAVSSGSDTDNGYMGGARRYSGLTVNFEYMEPQRRP